MRDALDKLVDQMLEKGMHFEDARRAFEHRFIARALAQGNGSLVKVAEQIGLHRNTLSRKMAEFRLRRKP